MTRMMLPADGFWFRLGVSLAAWTLVMVVTMVSAAEPGAENVVDTASEAPAEAAAGNVELRADLSPQEQELLARLVRAEAEGEPYAGKVAVAAVVLNRLEHPDFPNSVPEIVYQYRQFEPVLDGTINIPARPEDRAAVRDALAGWDPSDGALYFFNPSKTPNAFVWSRPPIKMIGNHRFTG